MQSAEAQISSLPLAEEIPALTPVEEKESDFRNNRTSSSSPMEECGGYIPSVFRGINTSGSYHVYGDHDAPAGKLQGSHKISAFSGGALSQKRCSRVANTNMSHSDSASTVSRSMPSHPSLPTATTRLTGGPAAPMEDSIQHPQTSCLRLSPGFSKGVICSPQSPLRSDCQPNSPTESSSSRNAIMSLKQPSDYAKDAKARNWKKYKFIVMNQTPNENDQEGHGGSGEASATSPTLSPCRTVGAGQQSEVLADDEMNEHRDETPAVQSVDSCSDIR